MLATVDCLVDAGADGADEHLVWTVKEESLAGIAEH